MKSAKDNYSKNYRLFLNLLKKHSQENPFNGLSIYLCHINQAILLPITADTQDTALTIFLH